MGIRHRSSHEVNGKAELLIVDDVKLFLHLSEAMLSREDYIVHTAMNGQEALDIARRTRPDAILCDLYMPGMDGDEVCRQIRNDPAICHTPIIMITTESDGEGRRRCMYAGCDDFLTKPVRTDLLNRTVKKHLDVWERTHVRTDVLMPCILDNGDDLIRTNIRTLSAGGAFVEMDPPPLPDSLHRLTFSLPEEKEHFSIRALARWNRLMFRDRPVGSGFEFVEMEEGNPDRLSLWVENILDDPVFA